MAFTVGLTDRRGNPIPDAKVAVIPQYGRGEPGDLPLTSPSTNATGVAHGSVPVEELEQQALGRGPLNEQWHARPSKRHRQRGVLLQRVDLGEMPGDVVREVNDALERFRSAE
ncbi:MAG TPA: hypothetical protein VM287_04425 [Egibacteraceae bacterium]|nr:hypothetical protein [Egibacteraceae bacterium]